MRVFIYLVVLFGFLDISHAATEKHLIEYRRVTSAIVAGKKCIAREISKSDLSEFVKAWKLAKYKGADKYKSDLTLTIVLDNGGVRVFQIKDKKVRESGNGETWSMKKNLSSLCS